MKTIIPILSLSLLLFACDSKTNDADKLMQPMAVDTTGLSEFQDWKAMNERAKEEPPATVQYAAPPPVQKVIYRTIEQPRVVQPAPETVYENPQPTTDERNSTTRDDAGVGDGEVASTGEGTADDTGIGQAEEKKGISKAAKGAIIGGVGGAAAGAILNKKNRAAGAVIGGVIGAGGGYVLGKKMDKKDSSN